MEIIVGSIPPLPPQAGKRQERSTPLIEAKLLNSRPPRRGIAGPSGMERRGKSVKDPHKGRVITVLVPDGDMLPADLDSGLYSVLLKFVKK